MASDLETQLREYGRVLDTHAPAVSVEELSRRSGVVEAATDADAGRRRGVRVHEQHPRRVLLVAAAVVVVVGLIGVIAVLDRSPEPTSPAESVPERPEPTPSTEPEPTPSTEPEARPATTTVRPVEVAMLEVTITPNDSSTPRPDRYPIVQDPQVVNVTGQYVQRSDLTPVANALVGSIVANSLSDAIRFELVPGFTPPNEPEVVDVNGVNLDVYRAGEVSTVVLPGEPTITVSGRDPESFLRATGLDVVSFSTDGTSDTFMIDESVLPTGYETIVEPQTEPADALLAFTATSLPGSDGPAITVSLTSPLPSFATSGTVDRTDVNGATAWAAPSPGGSTIIWQVSESTWAQARVRGAPDESLTVAESVDFASEIDFVDETRWRSTYQVPEPSFGNDDGLIGIDAGRSDGVGPGMLVESGGAPIGRVANVDETSSSVVLASSPDFSVDALAVGTTPPEGAVECRVRGGNDHIGYVCDRPFNEQEQPGARIVAFGNAPTITDGTNLGTITSIADINGEPVALLDLPTEPPIAGDTATVLITS